MYSCLVFVKAVLLQHGKYDSVISDRHILDFDINGEWSDVAYDSSCFFMARQPLVSQGFLVVEVVFSKHSNQILEHFRNKC